MFRQTRMQGGGVGLRLETWNQTLADTIQDPGLWNHLFWANYQRGRCLGDHTRPQTSTPLPGLFSKKCGGILG